MTHLTQSTSSQRIPWMRRVITYALVLLVGFALGFVPMLLVSRQSANSLAEATGRAALAETRNALLSTRAEHQLLLAKLQNTLASAAIDTQRGDYEAASQTASDFFTFLREEANKGDDSSLSQAQKAGVEPLFDRRDELISLLARNDPAASGRLSDLYVSFRELMTQ